jgi:acetyltransferase-like isoleucine patch superfamily enzyme
MVESKIPPLLSNDSRLTIGRFSYGLPTFRMWHPDERIEIGAFCSIAQDVLILGGGEHRLDWVSTFPFRIAFGDPEAERDGHPASKGPTIIGNDVWIATRATILSGCRIGHGAVVGAGAVVSGVVPPYSIVAGNPARVVRSRFDTPVIESLLQIAWWDWPIERIRDFVPLICAACPEKFIEAAHACATNATASS